MPNFTKDEYQALGIVIKAHPDTRIYIRTEFGGTATIGDGKEGSTTDVARIMNRQRASEQIDEGEIETWRFRRAVEPDELDQRSVAEIATYNSYLGDEKVDMKNPAIRTMIRRYFKPDSKTRANLNGLKTRDGSLAERESHVGAVMTHTDVAKALKA